MNKTPALCPPLALTVGLLVTACGPEKTEPEPNYEEGKTLARHGALMMQSIEGGLNDNTRVFMGSHAPQVAAFSSDVESLLNDEALAQTVLAAFLSTVPIYRLDKEARVYAEEFQAGNITLMDLIPAGEFTEPATNLSVNFQAEENNGSFEITIDLLGEFDACAITGGTPDYCATQIDMSFVLRESGLSYGRTDASNTESYIVGKERFSLAFSGAIENAGYQLDIQNGSFEINGNPLSNFEYEFTPRSVPLQDSFAMKFPATELAFDASFTSKGERNITKIDLPLRLKFDNWQFASTGEFEEGDPSTQGGARITDFAMNGLNITFGRIDFTHNNGNKAWLNLDFSSGFETEEASSNIYRPCTSYLDCFSAIVSNTVELFYFGAEETPAIDLDIDYGFVFGYQALNASNHYSRNTEFNNQWIITSDYEDQFYRGTIDKDAWFANTTLEFTNASGARIFATKNSDGILNGNIVDSEGLNIGTVGVINSEVIAQFNDGSNITLGIE